MYTEKNFNDDLFQICQSQFVKFRLLQDFAYKRISQQDFVSQISERKDRDEVSQVLNEIYKLQQKVERNGGLDEDVIKSAQALRKKGELKDAFNKIAPYIQQNPNDEDANITFGWVMYDYLKASEGNAENYVRSLKALNDRVCFDFRTGNEYITTLLTQILWSIRRMATQGELFANKVFEEFKRFVGNSSSFIEQRQSYSWQAAYSDNNLSPSRLLIKDFRSKLNETNYFSLMDMIGFGWLDSFDFAVSSFKGKDGETVEMRPLAESMLNSHAKRLIQSDEQLATRERIEAFIPALTSAINRYAEYEWLPYYRVKLLMKLGDKTRAFSEVTEFARNKSRDFWVWDLISDLVDGNERFNCLCAGLLCKTKPEMIVGLQEKSISHLVKKGMYAEAKHILDMLIETRTKKEWKISAELQGLKSDDWYISCEPASTLNSLQPYADEAKKILYRSLPFSDVFVTYINDEKGVINFAYIECGITKEGYFYKDSAGGFDWETEKAIKVQMIADKKRDNLFHVFAVECGDEEFANHFIKAFKGTFEKVNEFGFIRDSIAELFVNPAMVKENELQPFSTVSGKVAKKWDKKKNRWGWQIVSINAVEKPKMSDYEMEVSGAIEITLKGFGFVSDCFVPADIIDGSGVREGDCIRAVAQKSWDKSKAKWSWKVTKIIDENSEYESWANEIEETLKTQQDNRDAEYREWVESTLAK